MGQKAIKQTKLTDKLTLSECLDGFWLYDYTRGMNLAMRAKTEIDAFVEAIEYYQRRTTEVETQLKDIKQRVNSFLEKFEDEDGQIKYY